MDYQKIYNQIIERAKTRELTGYIEKHHIIPKCLGGNNSEENLVKLTAKEHFLCHMLLCEIYPNEYKLKHALFLMAIGKQKFKEKIYIIGSRTYERLRKEYSDMLIGNKHSEETKYKKSIAMKNVWASKSKEDITQIAIKRAISRKQNGFYVTEQHRENIRKSLLGKKKENTLNYGKIVQQFDLNGNFIKEYFNTQEAERILGKNKHNIQNAARGSQKTAYGFIWKYKK